MSSDAYESINFDGRHQDGRIDSVHGLVSPWVYESTWRTLGTLAMAPSMSAICFGSNSAMRPPELLTSFCGLGFRILNLLPIHPLR